MSRFVRLCLIMCAPAIALSADTPTALACSVIMLLAALSSVIAARKCKGVFFSSFSAFVTTLCLCVGGNLLVGGIFPNFFPPQPTYALSAAPAFFAYPFALTGRGKRPVRLAFTALGCSLAVILTGFVREILTGCFLRERFTSYGLPVMGTFWGGAVFALLVIAAAEFLSGGREVGKCS